MTIEHVVGQALLQLLQGAPAYSSAASTSWIEHGPTIDQQAVVGAVQDAVDIVAGLKYRCE